MIKRITYIPSLLSSKPTAVRMGLIDVLFKALSLYLKYQLKISCNLISNKILPEIKFQEQLICLLMNYELNVTTFIKIIFKTLKQLMKSLKKCQTSSGNFIPLR